MQPSEIKQQITEAIGAHGTWKLKLNTAVARQKHEFSVRDVSMDNLCAFGKWLYAVPHDMQNSNDYQKVKALHARFHKAAAQVLRSLDAGQVDAAKALLQEDYHAVSQELVQALTHWKMQLH